MKIRKIQERGITSISIGCFKSIYENQTIEIRPLTILAGANSSGKSSFMQPSLLLKQTLEESYDPGTLLLSGPNVRFTSANQLLSRSTKTKCLDTFHIGIEISRKDTITIYYKKKGGKRGFEIKEMTFHNMKNIRTFHPNMNHDEIVNNIDPDDKSFFDFINKREKNLRWEVGIERCFLELRLLSNNDKSKIIMTRNMAGILESEIRRLIHLPALRGNPTRTYPTTAVGPHFPGTFEKYVASIIANWQSSKDKKMRKLNQWLTDLNLTWKVESKPISDTQVELRVGRLQRLKSGQAHDMVSIADVGFGVSQMLPVLVALIIAQPGQIVYLEQPEIHLHPKAKYLLANVFVEAALRGVKVIAETHSGLILRGIQTEVAKGRISPDLVKLHWFKRDIQSGSTEVISADMDKNGSFGDWPEDFDQVMLHAEDQYLNYAGD
jgi:predicted ATPase